MKKNIWNIRCLVNESFVLSPSTPAYYVVDCWIFSLGFIIASYLFSLWFCKPTQSPSLCRSCSVLHGKKGKTLCVCLSSPTALTLQNRTRQSLASKKVTFKKLRAFYSLMRQLNFFQLCSQDSAVGISIFQCIISVIKQYDIYYLQVYVFILKNREKQKKAEL